MSSGFRYIFVVLLTAAAVFAGLSLWPVLMDTLNNGRAQAAPAAPAVQPSAGGTATPIGAAVNSPPQRQPSWTFVEERERPPERKSWLYAQASVILRIKPGGTGHRAPSVSQAPLTILKGTRLWPVRTEGEWVMVRAPSGLLGYVHTNEVDSHIPFFNRKY